MDAKRYQVCDKSGKEISEHDLAWEAAEAVPPEGHIVDREQTAREMKAVKSYKRHLDH